MTNKHIIQDILQEEVFRADKKPEIAARGANPDAEEFKEAAANSAKQTAETETVSLGEGLYRLDLLHNSSLCLRIKYI